MSNYSVYTAGKREGVYQATLHFKVKNPNENYTILSFQMKQKMVWLTENQRVSHLTLRSSTHSWPTCKTCKVCTTMLIIIHVIICLGGNERD